MAKDKARRKPTKIPKVPVHGSFAHNSAFLVSIGNLVVNWSNNESVFLAMLQILLPDNSRSAVMVWYSHRTTVARLDLVNRLCREQVKDETLLKDIHRAISTFKNFSRTRNFYCHATYTYDKELNLVLASGATLTQEGEPIIFDDKKLDIAALNEIGHVSTQLGDFNRHVWGLVERLQTALGVRRVNHPRLPPEQK